MLPAWDGGAGGGEEQAVGGDADVGSWVDGEDVAELFDHDGFEVAEAGVVAAELF